MMFPGRGHHRSSSAAAERERVAREESNRSSFLLRLPPELRNYIYDLVVPKDQQLPICKTRDFVKACPLLAVSRQLQAEVIPVFFGSNTFTVLLRSLAKRNHHWKQTRSQKSFSEAAFASLRSFQLVNNFQCRPGRHRLPHCLHLDGAIVLVDRTKEKVVALPPICSAGISLPGSTSPRPFAGPDNHPCFLSCCAKARKESEDAMIREIKSAGLHFKHNKMYRGDVVLVAKECYQPC